MGEGRLFDWTSLSSGFWFCSNLGPHKKQKKGGTPPAKLADWIEDTTDAMKAPSKIADEGQPGGYASSCDEEDRQESEAMQKLQEEVCRLHNQVWPMHRCLCMLSCTQSPKPLGESKILQKH